MSYLDNLKSLRNKNTIEELTSKIEKTTKGGGFVRDERYFNPKTDKDGNASITMRFLPAPEGENDPYVKFLSVVFKNPQGKYFNNKSPRTNGNPCPVYEWNGATFNEFGKEDALKIIQKRGSGFQHRFVSNVLILKAELQPDDVGKVFLYEYGNQIFKLIEGATKQDEDDETKQVFDPFNPFTGANLLLKLKTKGTFQKNSEDSKFLGVTELYGGDEQKILEACQSSYSLKAEVAPDKFKSYDKLKAELDAVLGTGGKRAEDELVKPSKPVKVSGDSSGEPVKAKVESTTVDAMFDDDEDLPF